ncbi:MAG: peptidase S41 [Acidobacteria bacterium]|nr:MAG: peptidase S41 [Acidobacteriota bacterium]
MRALLRSVLPLLVCLAAAPAVAVEARLPRHPAPSPDGSRIAFSWQGDLFVVSRDGGPARRLTVHPAHESRPVWSRDGRSIAFASDRHGNDDVFVMPADGSAPPTRLTFASTPDEPAAFTPDGTRVLFTSRRDETIRRMPAIYSVPVEGGTPALEQPALGRWPSPSPDGTRLAFVRGGTYWWRQGYRGSANRDLWLRLADGTWQQVTTFDGDDDNPSWIGDDALVFSSTRTGRRNLHRLDLATGRVTALTAFRETGIRFPRAAADAPVVAFEHDDGIWVVDLAGDGTARRLTIDVPADAPWDALLRRTARDGATELAISPDGRTAAFIVESDVFVVGLRDKQAQEIAPPRTVRVTDTPGRERDLDWSPDGERLLFASDRAGNLDLFVATRTDAERPWSDNDAFEIAPLVAGPRDEFAGRFAPDGAHVAFVRGRGDLVVAAADGSDERVLFEHWYEPEFDWSPDGRYLAFSRTDVEFNSDVFLVSVEGGEPYNVSRHPDTDRSPRFSPDGRRLLWLTKRHADTIDVWGVWLAREDHERTPEQWLEVWADERGVQDRAGGERRRGRGKAAAAADADATQDTGDERALPEVRIDFDNLWKRARAITRLPGDEAAPFASEDGKKVFFVASPEGEADLYAVRFDGRKLERLTRGGKAPRAPRLSADGKTIFFLDKKGAIKRVGLDGKAGDPAPFAARWETPRDARRRATYDEAARTISAWFYDPGFHGVDFPRMIETYRPWALAAGTDRDFADVVNMLLGELNASHMGYRFTRPPQGERTGWIGALFDPRAGGPGLLVREVLDDSPATRVDVALRPGARILSIDGEPLDATTNVYGLLRDTAGRPVPLEIRDPDGTTRRVRIVPEDWRAQRRHRYDTWVRQRAAIVERASAGRLGYIHIQAMGISSFEEFEQALFAAAHGKEGLVIDVRSNGGGWTTDYLMTVLGVRRHAWTIPRGAPPDTRAYPQGRLPLSAWTRPAMALCDEESYSNAEIFSWAFRTLGRGLTAGSPTFGAVISTGGTRLLDGNLLRLPFRGWYVAGSGINMENHGFTPDLLIARPPDEDTATDRDTQLEQAVAAFLARIEDDPRYGSW